jgi:RNA polymerase sigma factor (sigma-70 family)
VSKRQKGHPLVAKKIFNLEGLLYREMDTNEHVADIEMVLRIQNGDSKGVSIIYERYRRDFVRWALKFARCSEDDAFEFYQASVTIVYDNIMTGKLDELSSSLKTYLFGVGKNLIWQYLRQKDRDMRLNAEYYLLKHMEQNKEGDVLAEERNLELISRCFSELGNPCHDLLDLYYYQKKSMEDITAELNYKNTDSAKNQKYKCMERLRKMVEAEIAKETIV